ncbi:hypothetical protein QIL17_gp1, partial [ssRNA phage Gerhypos.1_22]
ALSGVTALAIYNAKLPLVREVVTT